ncbi:MAG TPA: FUSC family protein [Burkholderiaceae bacterium]|nr:FUSC family protein [Burkholderiaceae bacterium]
MTLQYRIQPHRRLRHLLNPAVRYRHARLLHAVRVALGLLTCVVLTSLLNLSHGEWASITLLVVIGGLQHHGNIRRKAADRGLGTLIGAGVGLVILLAQSTFHHAWLGTLLILIACGICAFHAVGKGGYIALLAAITILIVAGHGDSGIADGLWRAVDVLVGIVIALLFSFALPLYATYSWRHKLADILMQSSQVYAAIAAGNLTGIPEPQRALGTQLVQLRALLPSVTDEIHVSKDQLEEVQHGLRVGISLLEVLAAIRGGIDGKDTQAFLDRYLRDIHRHIQGTLTDMSHALRQGEPRRLEHPEQPAADVDLESVPIRLAPYVRLTQRLSDTFDELRRHLVDTAGRWNI